MLFKHFMHANISIKPIYCINFLHVLSWINELESCIKFLPCSLRLFIWERNGARNVGIDGFFGPNQIPASIILLVLNLNNYIKWNQISQLESNCVNLFFSCFFFS